MRDANNPVWEVYDQLRTARLNVKYYAALLDRVERLKGFTESILLITAPGSAIAGLWFWGTILGTHLWQGLGAVSAVVAVISPALNLTGKIARYSVLLSGYRALEHDLLEIKIDISQSMQYDESNKRDLEKAVGRKGMLSAQSPDASENKKLVRKCSMEVEAELPVDKFYLPPYKLGA